jgi:transposase
VATAFPNAHVELWATDEHRIGLKPVLRRVWAPIGQRPLAPVQHRFAWRYLGSFVHPASGRTLFHLATSVSIPLFEAELAVFARAVGAGPTKQIVLVWDRAGWHTSLRLRVPEHVHLLFLPPSSPELQPAEPLWPLTNAALVNQHFASSEALEDAQLARCAALQAKPTVIRSTTCFHWWPSDCSGGPKIERTPGVVMNWADVPRMPLIPGISALTCRLTKVRPSSRTTRRRRQSPDAPAASQSQRSAFPGVRADILLRVRLNSHVAQTDSQTTRTEAELISHAGI